MRTKTMKTFHFLIAGLRARAEEARGAGPTGRTAALRDLQIQLEPRVPEVRSHFKAPREGWFLVPRGTGLQLMRFNNPASTKENKTTGNNNTATGASALVSNSTGSDNTATGVNALFSNTTGSSNIALGVAAGTNLTTGSNNIEIGNPGVAGESRTIRIGTGGTQTKTFIAGISGVTVPGGVGVIVGTNGKDRKSTRLNSSHRCISYAV